MTTRMTLLSNPRLAVFILFMAALLAAGIAMFYVGSFYGIAATAIALFIDWTMLKILRRQMRTTVTVDGDGARFDLYGEEKIDIAWPAVTLVGLAVEQGKRGRRARQLFFYKEDGDRLMVVPAEFDRFADVVAETRRYAPGFRDLDLAAGETVKEKLRSFLEPPAGTSASSPASNPADPPAGSPAMN